MSKYIKLATGEVKTQGEWRAANKHVSLPKVWKAATLESLGLTPVLAAPKPSVTELQRVESAGTTTDALGNTVEAWAVVDKYATLLEDGYVVKSKVEQEEEHLAAIVAAAAASKRRERDEALAATDWMAMSDVTMPADVTSYRQSLRDLPTHADFPYVDLPEAP